MGSDGYPNQCPVCGSDDIATDYIIGGDGEEIWIKCHCDECESSWGEAYRFCEIYEINEKDVAV